jgi:RNA polymerase sigma factor (sigma-70 family)
MDDASLVAAARCGDRAAAAALLERHRPRLLALCRRALNDPPLAEDAAQEALLQALLHLGELRDAARFGPWLRGIGLNTCRYWQRQRRRSRWSWEAMRAAGALAEPGDAGADPAAMLDRLDDVSAVRDALAALSRGQRAAVVLCYLAGLPIARAAAILGVEPGAVKARLHKARRALRAWLAPDGVIDAPRSATARPGRAAPAPSAGAAPGPASRRAAALRARPRRLAGGPDPWPWRSCHLRHFRVEVDTAAVAEAIVAFLGDTARRRGIVDLCIAVPEAAAVIDAMLLDGVAERRHVLAYVRAVFGTGPAPGKARGFFRLYVDLEPLADALHAFVRDPGASRRDRPVVAELEDVAPEVLAVLETMIVEGVTDRRHVAAYARALFGPTAV